MQTLPSTLAISFMVGLAYVTRYSGMDTVLGLSLTGTGVLFPFFGTLLGWLGVALTGTDAGSNALFGNLQKVTATQLGLSPILMGAANSTGGVMGKMIDAQSIVVASTATHQQGQRSGDLQGRVRPQHRAGVPRRARSCSPMPICSRPHPMTPHARDAVRRSRRGFCGAASGWRACSLAGRRCFAWLPLLAAQSHRCRATRSSVPPRRSTIDGKLDEAAWTAAPAVTLQFLWESQTGAKQMTPRPPALGCAGSLRRLRRRRRRHHRAVPAARRSDLP